MNNKGITPLISSVVLLLFAVGLGVVVMSWGQSATQKETYCDSSSIRIISFSGSDMACILKDAVSVTIENNGKNKITGLKVSLIGENDIYQEDIQKDIEVGGITKINVAKKNGNIVKQVRIAPFSGALCADSIAVTQNIQNC